MTSWMDKCNGEILDLFHEIEYVESDESVRVELETSHYRED
jgi:hypothetical protein